MVIGMSIMKVGVGKTKRKSTRCKQKSDALKFLQTFKIEKEVQPQKTTLSGFTKPSFPTRAQISAREQLSYIEEALKKLSSIAGDLPLSAFTPQHWDKYKSWRLQPNESGKSVSPVTVNMELRTLAGRSQYRISLETNRQQSFFLPKTLPRRGTIPYLLHKGRLSEAYWHDQGNLAKRNSHLCGDNWNEARRDPKLAMVEC